MKKTVMAMLMGLGAAASTVEWNAIDICSICGRRANGVNLNVVQGAGQSELPITYNYNGQGRVVSLKSDLNYMPLVIIDGLWVDAYVNDIIDLNYFEQARTVLLDYGSTGVTPQSTGSSLAISEGETAYLALTALYTTAFAEDMITPIATQQMFGWVEVTISQNQLEVVRSAFADAPLYCGAGLVPEPTSGLLMLIGITGLELKRRRT